MNLGELEVTYCEISIIKSSPPEVNHLCHMGSLASDVGLAQYPNMMNLSTINYSLGTISLIQYYKILHKLN